MSNWVWNSYNLAANSFVPSFSMCFLFNFSYTVILVHWFLTYQIHSLWLQVKCKRDIYNEVKSLLSEINLSIFDHNCQTFVCFFEFRFWILLASIVKPEKLPPEDIGKSCDTLRHPSTRIQSCLLWQSQCTSVLASAYFQFGSWIWSSSME